MPIYVPKLYSSVNHALKNIAPAIYNAVNFDLYVAPDPQYVSHDLSEVTVSITDHDYAFGIDRWSSIEFQIGTNGTDFDTVEIQYPGSTTAQYTYTDLNEGTKYYIRTRVTLDSGYWTSAIIYQWTDFMVEITSCKDSLGNNLSGAVVVALPEDELLALVEASPTGIDIPSLSYRKVNKTDSDGTCNIRIPGGKGRVWVLMIPASTSVGGHAIAHLGTEVTEEE